jgi:drug/metabolite transporter (DMT)-like permease
LSRASSRAALGYLIQVWAQRRISATRIALVFSLETVWAGSFGYLLADDRLGLAGWGGCALILAGILVAEPAAADALRRFVSVEKEPVLRGKMCYKGT